MAFIVTDQCIKCKYMDCVEVCPVDCFYEGENMLVIHPDECTDCGACEPECPAQAIEEEHANNKQWLELNRKYSLLWPRITQNRGPLPEADAQKGIQGKFERHFSEKPGLGTT